MATKTFKIGEYAKGGVITVEVNTKKENGVIIAKEWDMSQGTSKGSNQSNAKEWDRMYFDFNRNSAYHDVYMYLSDLTTHYYSSMIIDWIEDKGNKKLNNF